MLDFHVLIVKAGNNNDNIALNAFEMFYENKKDIIR